jgi:hypothetical protein
MRTASVPGSRLFRAGAIGYIVFAGVHFTAFIQEFLFPPTELVRVEAQRALRAVTVDMGPFHTDFSQLVRLLSGSYSTLLLCVGILNLVAFPAAAATSRLRSLTVVNLVFCGLLLALSVLARFPPPIVFGLIIEILFALSLARQGRSPARG